METKTSDIAAIFSKGILALIPFVGPLAAEIIGNLIPNQRWDRLEKFLIILEEKINKLDNGNVKEKFMTEESIDLMEDAFWQTSRAISDERKDYIAALIKNSLSDEELKHLEYKKLLSLLGQINDLEILILKSYSLYQGDDEYDDFWEKHEKALMPPSATLGSSQEEFDRDAIFEAHENHLVSLNLLKGQFRRPTRGELPEFDEKTGMMKAQGYDITSLGRLLLRSIDQGGEI
ncbi:MAG TPA: hypothetical protein PLK94_05995 [Alphaproteobacteria bacterium]|nr:hypothetical protein [Alphaproteobacteria bacterium]HPQ44924.1 hypothetical protein [Syntrophales bacterium]